MHADVKYIPSDIFELAHKQCDACGITPYSDMRFHAEYVAAFAIIAERERCMLIAVAFPSDKDRPHNEGLAQNAICTKIAAAIRN